MVCISKSDIILMLDAILREIRTASTLDEVYAYVSELREDIEYSAWEEFKYKIKGT